MTSTGFTHQELEAQVCIYPVETEQSDVTVDIRGAGNALYILYGKPALNPRYYCIGISMHVCEFCVVFVACI